MISVAAAGLLLGALVLAVPGLHEVLARIEGVAPGWIALAIALELVSCAGFVLAFRHVFSRLPGRPAAPAAADERPRMTAERRRRCEERAGTADAGRSPTSPPGRR